MEEEGKLIDGYLRYLRDDKNPGELNSYVHRQVFNSNDGNATEQTKVVNLIYSRAEHYKLIRINANNTKKNIISSNGLDVLKIGGYDKWRKIEDDKVERQIKRENGNYIINKILAGAAVISILISMGFGYYQLTNNTQIDNKLRDLTKQDSIFNQKLKTLMLLKKNQTKPTR